MYIDDAADDAIAIPIPIAFNAKAEQYAVCNAMETLLVADAIAAKVLPPLAARFAAKGIELRGCARTPELPPAARAATEADRREEYLGPILAIRVVPGLDEAIAHINECGSQHIDTIGTENFTRVRRFLTAVDSASVLVNASTQFAVGFEFGLGAEVRISTNKLHARGPIGTEGLTTQKFVLLGDCRIRNR